MTQEMDLRALRVYDSQNGSKGHTKMAQYIKMAQMTQHSVMRVWIMTDLMAIRAK